jgi:hypothetical protein
MITTLPELSDEQWLSRLARHHIETALRWDVYVALQRACIEYGSPVASMAGISP